MKIIDKIYRFDNKEEMQRWFCMMVSCGILPYGNYPVGIEYPSKCRLTFENGKYFPIFSYYVSKLTELKWRTNWNKVVAANPKLKNVDFKNLPLELQNFIQSNGSL